MPPTAITLTQSAVDENVTAAIIGAFVVSDGASGTHTLNLGEDAGGLFALNGNSLVLAPGAVLDFETAASHVITVRATDANGLSLDHAFTITVTNQPETLAGSAGADDIASNPGPDAVALGAGGADAVRGRLADLDGDSVSDCSGDDRIVFVDAQLGRSAITVTPGAATGLAVDGDGDGTVDAALTLDGEFSGGAFMTRIAGSETHLTFVPVLPTLSEGSELDAAAVNGVANPDFLASDGANSLRVSLDAAQMGAFLDNSLGVYEVDASGTLIKARLLTASVQADPGASFDITGIAAGHRLGFFLVQDGARWAEALAPGDALSFLDGGAPATLDSDGANVALAVNGVATEAIVFHSLAASLNPDGMTHVVSGATPDGTALTIGFEDQLDGGDLDYQDVVLSVSVIEPVQPVLPLPVSVAQDIATATGAGSAMILAPEVLGPLNAQPYTISVDVTGLGGSAIVLADGSISYDPLAAFEALPFGASATDEFSYSVTDSAGTTTDASVTVTVHGLNDAPTPVDDTITGPEDQALRLDVLSNDTDPDTGDTLIISAVRGVSNGTAEIASDGLSILFTPEANFDDGTTFEYQVRDQHGQTAWANVTAGFIGVNDAPSVSDQTGATEAGAAISLLLGKPEPEGISDLEDLNPFTLGRAYNDPDGYDDHVMVLDLTGVQGTVTQGEGGQITYDPGTAFLALGAGETAMETFSYTVTDLGGLSSTGIVEITVEGANDAPEAVDDTASTAEDTPLTIRPLSNDTDPDTGDSLTIVDLKASENGSATIGNDGMSILFVPDRDFNGTTVLEYQVSDSGGLRDWAAVEITVTPDNDTPVIADLAATTSETASVTLTPVFSDVDLGDTLTLSLDTSSTLGLVTLNADNTLTYDPNGAFDTLGDGATGTDSFEVTVTDAAGAEATATGTLLITGRNVTPVAVDDVATTPEDVPIALLPLTNDFDDDGDALRLVGLSNVENGSAQLRIDGRTVDFTPDADFNGTAGFTYTLQDPNGAEASAQVTLTVTPVNDAPVLTGYSLFIPQSEVGNSVDLPVNFTDPDIGDTHTFDVALDPSRSTGSEAFLFDGRPVYQATGFGGAAGGEERIDTLILTVTDAGGLSDSVEIISSTLGVNDPPTDFFTTGRGAEDAGPFIIAISSVVDPDGLDTHAITAIANPVNGTVQLLGDGTIAFTPDPNVYGTVSVDVTIEDPFGAAFTKTMLHQVTPTADPITLDFTATAAGPVNQFYLDVDAASTVPDSGEMLRNVMFEAVDSTGALLPNQAAYLSETSVSVTPTFLGTPPARVLVTIPDDAPSDFGIRATATAGVGSAFAPEPGQTFTATEVFDVSWAKSTNAFEETVPFTNQSIWSSGDNDRHELSFTVGGTIAPGIDLSETLLYLNLTAGGVGAKTHISGAIGVNSLISFGLRNTMYVEGGGTSGGVTYDGQVSVTHNKVTDQVSFDTQALADLANSSFVAGSPSFGFSTHLSSLLFNLSAYAKIWGYVHFKTGVSTFGPEFNIGASESIGLNLADLVGPQGIELLSYDGNEVSVLEGLFTQQGRTFTKTWDSGAPFNNELASVTVTNPSLLSTSTPLNAASLTAGARQEFANYTLDLDGIAATLKNIQNPVSVSKGFGSESSAVSASISLDALDLDLVNRLSYQQNHLLTPGDLAGVLVLEDGDRFVFNFGDTVDVGTLASHDENGDGRLEYHFELDPDAQFQTKAQLLFEQFDQLDILSAAFKGAINLGPLDESFSIPLGPWKSTNSNVVDREKFIPITTQDFALDFDEFSTGTFLL